MESMCPHNSAATELCVKITKIYFAWHLSDFLMFFVTIISIKERKTSILCLLFLQPELDGKMHLPLQKWDENSPVTNTNYTPYIANTNVTCIIQQ